MSRTDTHGGRRIFGHDAEVRGLAKESERRARQQVRQQLGRVPRVLHNGWTPTLEEQTDVDVPPTRHRREALNAW